MKLKHSFKLFLVFFLAFFTVFPLYANADTVDDQLNYVSLGNSLAAGVSSDDTLIKGYTDFIKEGIEGQTEYKVNLLKKGTPGFTTANVLNQLSDSTVRAALSEADIITIDIGANDLLQAVADIKNVDPNNPEQLAELQKNAETALTQVGINLAVILNQIKSINPEAPVYVMGYYNAMPYLEGMQVHVEQLMQSLNGAIAVAGQAGGATFVPTYAAFNGKYEEYLPNPNNIHPNEAGYKVIGDLFLAQIVPNLAPIEKPNPDPDPVPEPEPTVAWSYGEGAPDASLGGEAALYLDILTFDVYQKADGTWTMIGNLATPSEDSPWLVGAGEPNSEVGVLGDLYVDMTNKAVYFKLNHGWILVSKLAEPDPEPETPAVWSYGKGAPDASVEEIANLYLDIESADVYEKSDGKWTKTSNLKNHSKDSPWLAGEGKPGSEVGKLGELYVDTAKKSIYFKLETGWILVGDFAVPEKKPNPDDEEDPEKDDEQQPVAKDKDKDKDKDKSKGAINKKKDKSKKSASKSEDKKKTVVKSGKLPNTATNIYLYMAIGLGLLLSGVGLTIIRKVRMIKS